MQSTENNIRKPILCDYKTCTGCSSCANSCAKKAISIELNNEGYYNPVIDYNKCISCYVCESRCPIITHQAKHTQKPKAYSAWIKDEHARNQSSSGGIFTAVATVVLNNGGAVWGAGYSDEMTTIYKYVECTENLNEIRGSKYVQCKVGDSFHQIKKQLSDGRIVLFCGTPCHVAGLYAFLNGKLIDNLITIDFICHGVPSPKLFENYLKWLAQKYDDDVINFNFRESRFGQNYNVGTSATFKNKGKKWLYLSDNSYTLGFCRDLTIHKACNLCAFNGTQRLSDFTLGDYHCAKKEFNTHQQFLGISCLILNSEKAKKMLLEMEVNYKEVSLEKIIDSNPNYTRHKVCTSTLNLEEICSLPFNDVQKKYFVPSLKDTIKVLLLRTLGGRIAYVLKNIK